MVTCRVELPYTDSNQTIRFVFSSCQHFISPQFVRKRFRAFLERELAVDQTYLVLFGDVFDVITPADSKRFQPSVIDPAYYEKGPDRFVNTALDDVESELGPYREKILGILMGNHEYQYLRRYGLNLTEILCNRLGTRNLGLSFLMRILLRRYRENGNSRPTGDRVRSLVMYGHHGFGGGSRTEGGGLTKYERTIKKFDADVYAFGHDHDSWAKAIPRVGVNQSGGVVDKPLYLICCGTFKRSLSLDELPTWEETRGFGPTRLGGAVLEVTVLNNKWLHLQAQT